MEKVKIRDFIKDQKIGPAHAAGFLAYLRMDEEREVEMSHLNESYRQFSGKSAMSDDIPESFVSGIQDHPPLPASESGDGNADDVLKSKFGRNRKRTDSDSNAEAQ